MTKTCWRATRFAALMAGLVLCAAAALSACGENACFNPPSQPIIGFVVTITTGVGTDANIHFCFTRKSTSARECTLLDKAFSDDFEPLHEDTYNWTLETPIAVGDLHELIISNNGGSFLGLDDDWTMKGLHIEAVLDGEPPFVLLSDDDISEEMSSGDRYVCLQCA